MCISLKHLVSIFGLILLSACQSENSSSTNVTPDNGASKNKIISLIHMNDLHAHLVPHNDYEYNQGKIVIRKNGGLARIASAITQIRKENKNTVLMNIGDTYHGGVEAMYTNGNAIVDPVNSLNIDIGVPGNWDFAYGPSVTRLRYTGQGANPTGVEIKSVNYPSLAANVSSTTPQDFLPATHTVNLDGIQIGFIGITSDIVPRMFSGLAIGFDFLQGKENYINLINTHATQLRDQGVDLVIVLSELGIHKDIALADTINNNSVNIFFSAHTHELTQTPLDSLSGALVVEAGNDTSLGRMDITLDGNKQLLETRWSVLSIDESYPEDPAMTILVENARAPFLASSVNMSLPLPIASQTLTQPINTVIGHSNLTLDRRNALENYFNAAFTERLKQYAGTDIAITPGFRYDSVIPAAGFLYEDNSIATGKITIEDAYRFFPVSFNLATGTTSGARLKSIIEENLSAVFSTDTFKHSGGWFDGFAGSNIYLNLSNTDGKRIVNMQYVGTQQSILDTDTLNVAGCVRPVELDSGTTLCSYDGFENVTALNNPETGAPWTSIDFLIEQISLNLLPDSHQQHVHDQSNTLMWPDTEYVQPLRGAE